MGLVSTFVFENIAVSAVQDLFEIVTDDPATGALYTGRVRRISLTSNATSPEKIRLTIARRGAFASSGSGGAGVTPRYLSKMFGGVADPIGERNNTTRVSGDTPEILYNDFWDISRRFDWAPLGRDGDFRLKGGTIGNSATAFTVGLESAPSTSKQMSGVVEVESL